MRVHACVCWSPQKLTPAPTVHKLVALQTHNLQVTPQTIKYKPFPPSLVSSRPKNIKTQLNIQAEVLLGEHGGQLMWLLLWSVSVKKKPIGEHRFFFQ